jgi:hypothetical protein
MIESPNEKRIAFLPGQHDGQFLFLLDESSTQGCHCESFRERAVNHRVNDESSF